MLHAREIDSVFESDSVTRIKIDYSDFETYIEPGRETLECDPQRPTSAKPGSVEKVTTLAARYAAGLPLWHNADCSDHSVIAADHAVD